MTITGQPATSRDSLGRTLRPRRAYYRTPEQDKGRPRQPVPDPRPAWWPPPFGTSLQDLPLDRVFRKMQDARHYGHWCEKQLPDWRVEEVLPVMGDSMYYVRLRHNFHGASVHIRSVGQVETFVAGEMEGLGE